MPLAERLLDARNNEDRGSRTFVAAASELSAGLGGGWAPYNFAQPNGSPLPHCEGRADLEVKKAKLGAQELDWGSNQLPWSDGPKG